MLDEFKNAFQRHNNAHVQLIIINVVVFLVFVLLSLSRLFGEPEIFYAVHDQVAIPAVIEAFIMKPWTIITYAFVHDVSGIFHILFNMMAFYWFGRLIIEYLGNDKLIALYFLGAIAGGLTYLATFNTVPYFYTTFPNSSLIGASAAVFAVMVAAATLLPDYTFFLLFFGPVRIKYIALVLIVVSFIGLNQSNALGEVSHLGGALIGFVYVKQLKAGYDWGKWITAIITAIKSIFKKRPKVKVTYRKAEPRKAEARKAPSTFSKSTQAEIDTILDKISDRGYESLTKDEKEKLFNASKK